MIPILYDPSSEELAQAEKDSNCLARASKEPRPHFGHRRDDGE